MKNTLLLITLSSSIGLLSFTSTTSHASSIISFPTIHLAQAAGKSLSATAQSIKKRTGGRILSTKTIKKNGQHVYKVKVLLPSGRVKTFTVKAQ